ncbi:MAG TPA: metalloregulator ArsR/SmtB family transcription factor [Pyrinomonadaceae bacterium]|nr:metalloregulator ArsR/SmtB family transcription factor [Pyrinomonadaceae bacterium]
MKTQYLQRRISVKPYVRHRAKITVVNKRSNEFNKELFFRALADRTRLRLLNLMRGDEVCVCFFVEILKTNQPKISRHLAYLRRAGIVGVRRQGQWMHYRVVEPAEPNAAQVLKEVMSWLESDKEMQRDRERLVKVCCAPQLPVRIQSAPRPASLAVR